MGGVLEELKKRGHVIKVHCVHERDSQRINKKKFLKSMNVSPRERGLAGHKQYLLRI